MSDKLKKLAVASFDLKGFATGLVDEVIEEALKKVVTDSSNTIDDALFPILWPLLEEEAKKLIEEKLDLGDILGLPEGE